MSLAIVLFAAVTVLLLWSRIAPGSFLIGLAAMLLAGAIVAAVWLLHVRSETIENPRDWTLLHAALADGGDATLITDRNGDPVCVSPSFTSLFGGPIKPEALPLPATDRARLAAAARVAMRDGQAEVDELAFADGPARALLRRAGRRDDHLVWRFRRTGPQSEYGLVRSLLDGRGGQRLGEAGVMLALVEPSGRIVATNEVFAYRALGEVGANAAGMDISELLETSDDGGVRIARDPIETPPLRIVPVALEDDPAEGASVFLMFDEDPDAMTAAAAAGAATVHSSS